MDGVDVCAVADLEEGVPTLVKAAGRELVVARWRGEVYALRNVCPHQTQSFVCGNVHARLRGSSRPGGMVADDREPVIACPWHTWEFKLTDGRCITDDKLRVKTYPVQVERGRVMVDVATKPARGRKA